MSESMGILIGFTGCLVLVIFAVQAVALKRLRTARAELARLREAMARRRFALPVIACDEQGRITDLYFDLDPVPTEGELHFRIPIMRGVPKMTMGAPDAAGDEVRLVVDFEAGVITRATADDNLLPRLAVAVPQAFRRAFDG